MAGPTIDKISIDNTAYDSALKELGAVKMALCDPCFSKPERTAVSIPFEKYEEKFLEIETLLNLYKKLLEKQLSSLKGIYDELNAADSAYSVNVPMPAPTAQGTPLSTPSVNPLADSPINASTPPITANGITPEV